MKKVIIRDAIILIIGLSVIIFLIKMPTAGPINNVELNEEAVALIESGVPEEVVKNYGARWVGEIWPEFEIVALSNESEWDILFEEEETVQGKWRGTEPKLLLFECFVEKVFNGTTKTKKWGESLSAGSEDVMPEFSVSLPTPNPDCLHTIIKAKASMTFRYPEFSKNKTFNNYKKTIEREIKFFIISEEELSVLQEIFPAFRISTVFRIVLIGIIIVFFIVFGLLEWDEHYSY